MGLKLGTTLGATLKRFGRAMFGPVPEVPPELEACEVGCRETECSQERWETCENRLRHMAFRLAKDAERDRAG